MKQGSRSTAENVNEEHIMELFADVEQIDKRMDQLEQTVAGGFKEIMSKMESLRLIS